MCELKNMYLAEVYEEYNISKNFSRILFDKDIKKRELSEMSGVSLTTLWKLHKDNDDYILEKIIGIASALNISLEDLIVDKRVVSRCN